MAKGITEKLFEVKFKGKSINDVLNTTIDDACVFSKKSTTSTVE